MNSSTDVMDYHIRQTLSAFYVYKKENCVFHVVTWLTVTLSVLFSVLSYSLQIKASVKWIKKCVLFLTQTNRFTSWDIIRRKRWMCKCCSPGQWWREIHFQQPRPEVRINKNVKSIQLWKMRRTQTLLDERNFPHDFTHLNTNITAENESHVHTQREKI